MTCTGVKFTHLVGGKYSMPNGLGHLMDDREVPFEEGDVIEVSLNVVPRDQIKKKRSLVRWLKQIGERL